MNPNDRHSTQLTDQALDTIEKAGHDLTRCPQVILTACQWDGYWGPGPGSSQTLPVGTTGEVPTQASETSSPGVLN